MRPISVILLCALGMVFISSCKDKVDESDIYTFRGTTIKQFIENKNDLSLFNKLIHISHISERSPSIVASLLGTVGQFTVFAPSNAAVKNYLDSYYGEDNYLIDESTLKSGF